MEKKKIKSFHLQRRGGINQKVSLAIQLSILTRDIQIITIIYMYIYVHIHFINIHDFRVWVVIMCLKHDMYYGSCLCWSNFIFIPSLFLSTGCSLYIVFFPKILEYSGLWSISVFPWFQCVYTQQAGSTPALQQNWQNAEK